MTTRKKKMEENTASTGIERSLRDDAEEQLARSPKISPRFEGQTAEELIHELQVHQIELETQAEELRRAHLALEESRDKYLDLYEFAPVGYLTLTDKALVKGANLTIATLLDIDRSKLVRTRFSKFIVEKDTNEWHRYFVSVLSQGGKQTSTLTLMRADGSTFPARLESIRIADDSAGTPTVRMAISDINDIKKVEDALRVSSKKLNILSGITRHDISNQLMVLVGNLDLMERQQSDIVSDDHFLQAKAATERISTMIKFTKEYEDVGVNAPVWQNVWTLVGSSAKIVPPGPIKVVNDVPASIEVYADPLIGKVFHNLIDNAARHGGKITTIHFFIDEHDGSYAIICEDDGVGISAEIKDKLFSHDSKKDHGFGLFLSREILAITGITIMEEGEQGLGARFIMTGPIRKVEDRKEGLDPIATKNSDSNRK
jgi:PAS domain S-box-containing protein